MTWLPSLRAAWIVLALFCAASAITALRAFFFLEAIGLACELLQVQGCSTLSYFYVWNAGAALVAEQQTIVGLVIAAFGVGYIAVWRFHAWDVARGQKK